MGAVVARVLAVGLALGLTGCGLFGPKLPFDPDAPPAELLQMTTTFSGPPGRGDVRIQLAVRNASGDTLEIREMDWKMYLSGKWFAAGIYTVNQPLPGRTEVVLPIELPLAFIQKVELGPGALNVGFRGELTLRKGEDDDRQWVFHWHKRIPTEGKPLMGQDNLSDE